MGRRWITIDTSRVSLDLYSLIFGQPNIASAAVVDGLLREAAKGAAGFPRHFLVNEWTEFVDAQQLAFWEAYRDAPRLGRKTRLGGKQRQALWRIFEAVQSGLAARKLVSWAHIFDRLAAHTRAGKSLGFDFAVVDEAQDVSIAEARFLPALAGDKPDGLFFTGDLGQRIFQQPFSWKSLGLEVRGRSHTLRINYRTSHQIRTQADRLLPGAVSDVDGTQESRHGTVSLFDGPAPVVRLFPDAAAETAAAGRWVADRLRRGAHHRRSACWSAHQHNSAVRAPR